VTLLFHLALGALVDVKPHAITTDAPPFHIFLVGTQMAASGQRACDACSDSRDKNCGVFTTG
jgi:hypothetical protein